MTRAEFEAARALARDPALRHDRPEVAAALAALAQSLEEAWEELARDDALLDRVSRRLARTVDGASLAPAIERVRSGLPPAEPRGTCAVDGCIYPPLAQGRCWQHAPPTCAAD